MTAATTELAPAGAGSLYPVLGPDASQKLAALKTNLGQGGLQLGDLDRITVPAGGGLAWTIPSVKGKKPAEAVQGILVGIQDQRAYWERGMEDGGGGSPPDCRSLDMVHGKGNPGGLCEACPLNEWGTGRNGSGTACGPFRLLFVLREGQTLPLVIKVPITSLAPVRKYLLALASEGIPYYGVVTRLKLEQVKSNSGITYSRIAAEMAAELATAELAGAEKYRAMIERFFGPGAQEPASPVAAHEPDDERVTPVVEEEEEIDPNDPFARS